MSYFIQDPKTGKLMFKGIDAFNRHYQLLLSTTDKQLLLKQSEAHIEVTNQLQELLNKLKVEGTPAAKKIIGATSLNLLLSYFLVIIAEYQREACDKTQENAMNWLAMATPLCAAYPESQQLIAMLSKELVNRHISYQAERILPFNPDRDFWVLSPLGLVFQHQQACVQHLLQLFQEGSAEQLSKHLVQLQNFESELTRALEQLPDNLAFRINRLVAMYFRLLCEFKIYKLSPKNIDTLNGLRVSIEPILPESTALTEVHGALGISLYSRIILFIGMLNLEIFLELEDYPYFILQALNLTESIHNIVNTFQESDATSDVHGLIRDCGVVKNKNARKPKAEDNPLAVSLNQNFGRHFRQVLENALKLPAIQTEKYHRIVITLLLQTRLPHENDTAIRQAFFADLALAPYHEVLLAWDKPTPEQLHRISRAFLEKNIKRLRDTICRFIIAGSSVELYEKHVRPVMQELACDTQIIGFFQSIATRLQVLSDNNSTVCYEADCIGSYKMASTGCFEYINSLFPSDENEQENQEHSDTPIDQNNPEKSRTQPRSEILLGMAQLAISRVKKQISAKHFSSLSLENARLQIRNFETSFLSTLQSTSDKNLRLRLTNVFLLSMAHFLVQMKHQELALELYKKVHSELNRKAFPYHHIFASWCLSEPCEKTLYALLNIDPVLLLEKEDFKDIVPLGFSEQFEKSKSKLSPELLKTIQKLQDFCLRSFTSLADIPFKSFTTKMPPFSSTLNEFSQKAIQLSSARLCVFGEAVFIAIVMPNSDRVFPLKHLEFTFEGSLEALKKLLAKLKGITVTHCENACVSLRFADDSVALVYPRPTALAAFLKNRNGFKSGLIAYDVRKKKCFDYFSHAEAVKQNPYVYQFSTSDVLSASHAWEALVCCARTKASGRTPQLPKRLTKLFDGLLDQQENHRLELREFVPRLFFHGFAECAFEILQPHNLLQKTFPFLAEVSENSLRGLFQIIDAQRLERPLAAARSAHVLTYLLASLIFLANPTLMEEIPAEEAIKTIETYLGALPFAVAAGSAEEIVRMLHRAYRTSKEIDISAAATACNAWLIIVTETELAQQSKQNFPLLSQLGGSQTAEVIPECNPTEDHSLK